MPIKKLAFCVVLMVCVVSRGLGATRVIAVTPTHFAVAACVRGTEGDFLLFWQAGEGTPESRIHYFTADGRPRWGIHGISWPNKGAERYNFSAALLSGNLQLIWLAKEG